MNKTALIYLLLLFSHSAWSETFELVCDIKFEPLTQGRYQIDTDSKTVTELGLYSGNTSSQTESLEYKTVGWDLELGMLIWVANDHETSDINRSGAINRTFDIIVFDLHNMQITVSRTARRNGLIEHINEFTEPCRRDENS